VPELCQLQAMCSHDISSCPSWIVWSRFRRDHLRIFALLAGGRFVTAAQDATGADADGNCAGAKRRDHAAAGPYALPYSRTTLATHGNAVRRAENGGSWGGDGSTPGMVPYDDSRTKFCTVHLSSMKFQIAH